MGIGGRGKKQDGKRRWGGCLAGFSVVFSSLKATLKKEKQSAKDTSRCFICFSASTFFGPL